MKKIVAVFICMVLSLNPLFVPLGNTQAISDKRQEDKRQEIFSNIDPVEKEVIETLFDRPASTALDLLELLGGLRREIEARLAQFQTELGASEGVEEFVKRVTSRRAKYEVPFEIPNVGKAELSSLGLHDKGRMFLKISHYPTQKVYLFLDASQISLKYLENHSIEFDHNEYKREHRLRTYLKEQLRFYIAKNLTLRRTIQWSQEVTRSPDSENRNFSVDLNVISSKEVDEKMSFLEKAWNETIGDPEAFDSKSEVIGRDVVLVWYESGKDPASNYDVRDDLRDNVREFHKLESTRSFAFWKEYWWSIWERPSFNDNYLNTQPWKIYFTGDYLLAWITCIAQAGMSLAFFTKSAALLSVIYSAVIGVNNKTFRNWSYRGPRGTQIAKSYAISSSFAYILFLLNHGFSEMAITTHLHLAQNNIANSVAKTEWFQVVRERQMAGENTYFVGVPKDFRVRMPKLHHWFSLGILTALTKMGLVKGAWIEDPQQRDTKLWTKGLQIELKEPIELQLDRAGLEQQLSYLGGYFFKLADQTGWKIETPWGSVRIGLILLWAHIPFIRYWSLRYIEEHQLPNAEMLREQWEADKAFGIPYLGLFGRITPSLLKAIASIPLVLLRVQLRMIFSLSQRGRAVLEKADDYKRQKQGFRPQQALQCRKLLF